jgi:hypothetical protein
MYFGTKSYLKSTRNHTTKHALRHKQPKLHRQPLFIFFLLSPKVNTLAMFFTLISKSVFGIIVAIIVVVWKKL